MQKDNAIEIRIAHSLSQVEALRSQWEQWSGHRDSDIDFYLAVVQSSPAVQAPHVIVLYRNGQPESMLIGRLETKELTFKLGYIQALRRKARSLTFVYGANRGESNVENCRLLVNEILESLQKKQADMAILEPLPLDSALHSLALEMPGALSRDTPQEPQEHNFMTLPDSIDEVYRRMSHDRRKDIRRKIKKFEASAGGPPQIVSYRHEADLATLFRDAEEIARKTYQRGLGVGFADSPEIRQRLGLAARKGWLRAYVVYLAGRPCAFWIGMLYGDTFVGEYIGYDREFQALSPGMFLTMRVIEGFCKRAEGDLVRELDFGFGQAEYKTALCNRLVQERAVFVFAPTLNGLILKLLRVTTMTVNQYAAKVLTSTNVLPKIKKAWRSRLAQRSRQAQAPTQENTANETNSSSAPDRIQGRVSAFPSERTEAAGSQS
jgi:hypothetical protein